MPLRAEGSVRLHAHEAAYLTYGELSQEQWTQPMGPGAGVEGGLGPSFWIFCRIQVRVGMSPLTPAKVKERGWVWLGPATLHKSHVKPVTIHTEQPRSEASGDQLDKEALTS